MNALKIPPIKAAAPVRQKPIRMSVVRNMLMRGKSGSKTKNMIGNY